MKKVVCFLSLYVFVTLPSKGQMEVTLNSAYTVLFDYTFQPNKEDTALKVSEPMVLHAGKQQSIFLSYYQYLNDSTLLAMAKETDANAALPPSLPRRPHQAKVMYRILKEPELRQFSYGSRFGVHEAFYKDSLFVLNWEMHDEQKDIAGYVCKKATTSFAGRNYIAWYTPDIILSDGPYKFSGLPGLILSIYDVEKHHVFTATSVLNNKREVMLRKWEGRFVYPLASKDEFKAYAQKMKEDPRRMFEQDVIRIPEDRMDEMAEKLKEGIKKNNNPLELESR